MNTTIILFIQLLLILSFPSYGNSTTTDSRAGSDMYANALEQNNAPVQQSPQRGIFQPRGSRLVFQVDGLTDAQRSRINELNLEHREQVSGLLEQLQNNQITRAEFIAQRRQNYDQHQAKLREVLTSAQWDQLQKLRAERRNLPANQ